MKRGQPLDKTQTGEFDIVPNSGYVAPRKTDPSLPGIESIADGLVKPSHPSQYISTHKVWSTLVCLGGNGDRYTRSTSDHIIL